MEIDPTVGAAVGEGRYEFGRDGKLTNRGRHRVPADEGFQRSVVMLTASPTPA
jgi:hypothetical protein